MVGKKMIFAAFSSLLSCLTAFGQAPAKPMSNDDVVALVKAHMSDTTIISVIQAQETSFDLSAAALIKLNQAGVKPAVLDAMIAANGKQRKAAEVNTQTSAQLTAQPAGASAAAPANPNLPSVAITQGASQKVLAASRTQIAQSKEKVSALSTMASNGSLTQALNSVAMTAANAASMKNVMAGANIMPMAMPMTTLAQTFMAHRKPTVTDVWALPGQKAETVVHAEQLAFDVHFESIPGINAMDYEPVLLKLEPTPNNFRLVGATQAKQDAMEGSAFDWGMYSSFVEERIAAQVQKTAAGNYHLQPSAPLAAGEYGVALRPVNKDKKFSGSSIGQNVGDGLIFNSVWAFEIQ